MRTLQAVLTAIMLIAGSTAQAQVYKWVDATGTTHYESTPPAAGKAQTLDIPASAAPASGQQGDSSWADKNNAFQARYDQKKAEEAKLEQQQLAERQARQRRCAQAQSRLNVMEAAGRLFRTDQDGNRIYYDDAQRAQAVADVKAAVAQNCN